nr:EOG090X08ST [Leptodora kindtii]
MLDKVKFLPLSVASSFTVRTALYPFTLVKTRLQVQRGNEVYRVFSGAFYILTYENVRHVLGTVNINDSKIKALIAGGCASLVGQTIIVPFDVISQHLMMMGLNQQGTPPPTDHQNHLVRVRNRTQMALAVTRDILQRDGVKGFYRGYMASLFTYVPSSALWWSFYHLYQDQLFNRVPSWFSQLSVQCTAAVLGGMTTTTLINPLDIIRARLQVQRLESIRATFAVLWKEERLGIFTKGLSARLIMSTFYSFSIILGYESVKRMSVKDKYREQVRW